MSKDNEPNGTKIEIEFKDGDYLINGKSLIPLIEAIEKEMEKTKWGAAEGVIAMAEIISSQCAVYDALNDDTYFLELFSTFLGKFYRDRRTLLAMTAASPPKDKMN